MPRSNPGVPPHKRPSKLQTAAAREELASPLIRAARWYLADGQI